ncbi:hypothetical protein [Clostridium estertheticum]|nr:hypothetical protein [Clostridium estertheticum]WLC78887.1 hypothetical protein KTC98_17080 [Clostridium estertheticum]
MDDILLYTDGRREEEVFLECVDGKISYCFLINKKNKMYLIKVNQK